MNNGASVRASGIHLRLPVEKWVDQITIPAEACVIDGPHAMIFAEHHEDQPGSDGEDQENDDHDDIFLELEPVPVRLLHRDDSVVVLQDDGIDPETVIALNHAHKLYLAMKMQAAGGGGHHHHDH